MNDLREERHIINLIKGGFEKEFNLTIKEFLDISYYLFENNQLKLKNQSVDLTKKQMVLQMSEEGIELKNGKPFNYYSFNYFLNYCKDLLINHPEKLI